MSNPGGDDIPSSRKKRVRFSNTADVFTVGAAEEDVVPANRRQRQTILPGEDESRSRRQTQWQELQPESQGPILPLDPVLAASRRARLRGRADASARLAAAAAAAAVAAAVTVTGVVGAEDVSLPDDLAAAEEDYEEPEELFNEAGIPFEPFHLRAEREAGYFDAEGNYLEYRLDAADRDAWLDSVMDEHRQVRADPQLAARRRQEAAG
ncbi:hypothetical protein Agub_g14629, partial [Astrephomene gubernaculifera]